MSKTTNRKLAPTAPPVDDRDTLTVHRLQDEPDAKALARVGMHPTLTAAVMVKDFGKGYISTLGLNECIEVLSETSKAVHRGDLREAETMLTAQAVSLNVVFTELARRAALNMGEYPDAFERYMRLALKAQGQCRATLETLAAIKNPPVVYAKQANINNGGQQQVNNGTAAPDALPVSKAESSIIEGAGGIESLPAPNRDTAPIPTRRKNSPLNRPSKR